jgi:RNA polymerase subunit RPABC4/transcription elongation factor Spt4
MKKKICKNCKLFVEGAECPLCKGKQFVSNWKGRIAVVDFSRSRIAEKIGMKANGEYAIKAK